MANLDRTSMSDGIKTFYDLALLERAQNRLVHSRFGKKARLNKFGSHEWRRYEAMSAVTSALTEGTTPAEQAAPTLTLVTATPSFYGAYIAHTDELDLTIIDPLIAEFSDILGEQAGLSIDTLSRNALTAGASKLYSAEQTARTNLAVGSHEISYTDLLLALATLMGNNALPQENGMYPVIIHPDTWATLYGDATFVAMFQQESSRDANSPLRSGYVGTFLNCEFYVSANSREYVDGGVGTADVYSMLFIGRNAYGIAGMGELDFNEVDAAGVEGLPLTGQAIRPVEVIVKTVGSAGADDPINQRGTAAWKVSHDLQILNSAFVVDMEHLTISS